jgi:uncharacterized protein (DUF488 family)
MDLTVFTWGYQSRTLADLTQLVADRGVEVIVDVRGNPYSRRREWVKEQLELFFPGRYEWIGWFGNKNYRQGGEPKLRDPVRGLADFRRAVVERGARRVLLLCYEKESARCHRTQVAELIRSELAEGNGIFVEHLA